MNIFAILRTLHAAPSKGRRFIEAVGFAKGLLGADVSDILSSARVKGVSISSDPSPPRKKYPFTVDQLVQLHLLHSSCKVAVV